MGLLFILFLVTCKLSQVKNCHLCARSEDLILINKPHNSLDTQAQQAALNATKTAISLQQFTLLEHHKKLAAIASDSVARDRD